MTIEFQIFDTRIIIKEGQQLAFWGLGIGVLYWADCRAGICAIPLISCPQYEDYDLWFILWSANPGKMPFLPLLCDDSMKKCARGSYCRQPSIKDVYWSFRFDPTFAPKGNIDDDKGRRRSGGAVPGNEKYSRIGNMNTAFSETRVQYFLRYTSFRLPQTGWLCSEINTGFLAVRLGGHAPNFVA